MSQFPPQQPPGSPDWGPPPAGGPDWNQQPPSDPGYGQQSPAPGPAGAPPPGWGGEPGYGQQPPPGYGQQPPGYGGPPGHGPQAQPGFGGPPAKKSPLVPILLIVAVVAVVAIGAFFLLSGDDDGSGPEAAARAYGEATIDGDCGKMTDLVMMDGQTAEEFRATCETVFGGGEVEGLPAEALDELPSEILSSNLDEETDSTATVTVEFRTRGGSTTTETIELTKQDGDWKVNLDGDVSPDDLDVPDAPSDTTVEPPGGGDEGSSGDATAPPLDNEEAQSDPSLVEYATLCQAGDMAACDDLWLNTDVGGELEAYGSTCGGRLDEETSGNCETRLG